MTAPGAPPSPADPHAVVREPRRGERPTAWVGLWAGPIAWLVHHQVGSDLVYYDCARFGPALVILLGLACAGVAAVGGWVSWRARATDDREASASRRFGARIAALGALLFALVILAQTTAGAFYAGCEQ